MTIPASVTTISNDVFSYCTALTKVEISDIDAWCKISLASNTSNPLVYAHHLYLNGEEVKDLVIPDGISLIRDYAFTGCSNLTSVTIPNSVTSIEKGAFSGCSNITAIISKIEQPFALESKVFKDIPYTAWLYVPVGTSELYRNTAGWSKFSDNMFEGDGIIPEDAIIFSDAKVNKICLKMWDDNKDSFLTTGEVAKVTDLGLTFSQSYINTFDELQYFTGLTSIGEEAFFVCENLTSVTIPNSVTTIGYKAFYFCTNLQSISIPEGITSIGNQSFGYCVKLTSINIPQSVTSIGEYVFAECRSLTSITSGIEEPFPIDPNVFDESTYSGATLYVPAGKKAKYVATTGWNKFKTIIEMTSTLPGDANGDGVVNVVDITAIVNYLNGKNPEGFKEDLADVDGSGQVTYADVDAVVKIIMGCSPTGVLNSEIEPEQEDYRANDDGNDI